MAATKGKTVSGSQSTMNTGVMVLCIAVVVRLAKAGWQDTVLGCTIVGGSYVLLAIVLIAATGE